MKPGFPPKCIIQPWSTWAGTLQLTLENFLRLPHPFVLWNRTVWRRSRSNVICPNMEQALNKSFFSWEKDTASMEEPTHHSSAKASKMLTWNSYTDLVQESQVTCIMSGLGGNDWVFLLCFLYKAVSDYLNSNSPIHHTQSNQT